MDSGVPPPTATATRSSAVQCQPRVQTLVLGGLQETQCLVGTLGRHGKPVGLPSRGLRPTHLSSLIQLAAYTLIRSFVHPLIALLGFHGKQTGLSGRVLLSLPVEGRAEGASVEPSWGRSEMG